jgi:hypothetical protein
MNSRDMMRRRKRSDPNRSGWSEQLCLMKAEVDAMPPGPAREAADRRAKQLEAAIEMRNWLKAPETSPLG